MRRREFILSALATVALGFPTAVQAKADGGWGRGGKPKPVTTTAPSTTTTTVVPPESSTTTTTQNTTTTTADPIDLQATINAAPSGSTVVIPAGVYAPIVVPRPMTLEWQPGAVIEGGKIGVDIRSGGVTLLDPVVRGSSFTGIYANGAYPGLTVRRPRVYDCGDFGIHFQNGPSNVLIEDGICHDFAGLLYPPHAYYLKYVTNATIRRCEGYYLGHKPNGYSGVQLSNVSNALVEDCDMHDCRGAGENDGYGYIADGSTVVTYRRCVGSANYFDFYEVALSGTAVYEECVGTKRVWP